MPVGPEGWRGWQGASIDFALTISMRDTKALFYGLRGSHSGAPTKRPWQNGKHTLKQRLKLLWYRFAYRLTDFARSNTSGETSG